MLRRPNLAIDGLAASGKTTVARQLAERLGLFYLDTGLMYRCVALAWLRAHPDAAAVGEPEAPLAEARVVSLLNSLDLAIQTRSEPVASCRMVLNGQDVTDQLHQPQVSRLVSRVAAISAIRRDLVARQQAFARQGGVVMVGRDIATVVMPDAELKIFLVADLNVRAARRLQELGPQSHTTLEEVTRDLAERDRIDTERADSPLTCVPEAHRVDTSALTPEEVLNRLADLVARVA